MSLDLNERQRAMLKEMGVTVWWPQAAQALAATPTAKDSSGPVAPNEVAENKLNYIEFKKLNKENIANIESNNIAVNVSNIRTIDRINLDSVSESDLIENKIRLGALSWPELAHEAAVCRACKLCEGRTQTVFGSSGVAPEPAPVVDWLIVGDLPGDAEDEAGQPFAGDAGQLMDNMLKAMGLSRGRSVYLTTVIKCRPPGNRNPLPDEVAQCALYLYRQIELLQPKIILTVGKLAAQALLRDTLPDVDKLPPGKLRGQVHTYLPNGANRPVVATYPPAYLLRNPQEKARVWEDLVMAMERAKRGT